jgi:hypothetical protein
MWTDIKQSMGAGLVVLIGSLLVIFILSWIISLF